MSDDQMYGIDISFGNKRCSILIEDESLYDDFTAVFGASQSDIIVPSVSAKIEVKGISKHEYSVCREGHRTNDGLTREQAAYSLTRIIGEEICSLCPQQQV